MFKDDPLFEKTVRNLFPVSAERFEGLYSCKDGFCWIFRRPDGNPRLGARWSFGERAFAADIKYMRLRQFLKENYPEAFI